MQALIRPVRFQRLGVPAVMSGQPVVADPGPHEDDADDDGNLWPGPQPAAFAMRPSDPSSPIALVVPN